MNDIGLDPFADMSSGLDPRPEGLDVFQAMIVRAIAAQQAAPADQRAVQPYILPPAFITAEVERLTEAERAAVLAYFAGKRVPYRWPFQRDYLRNTFQALIGAIDRFAPQAAADVLSTFAKDTVSPTNAGLKKVLTKLERAGPATYAGYAPLAEAYARLHSRRRLHQSRVEDEELAARFRRLFDLAATPADANAADGNAGHPADGASSDDAAVRFRVLFGLAAPPADANAADNDAGRPADEASADAEAIDAYVAALEGLVAELTAWIAQLSAGDPDFQETAVEHWVSEGRSQGVSRRKQDAPISCAAGLTPPPPQWLLDAGTLFDPRDRDAGNFNRLVLGIQEPDFVDRTWLNAGRRAARQLARTRYLHDWRQPAIVKRALLRLPAAQQPDALFDLLWQARSAVPTNKWLASAEKLLASPDGAAARAAARSWLELVPIQGLPAAEVAHRARVYETFCIDARRSISRYGGARNAAIANLCTWGGRAEIRKSERQTTRDRALISEENSLVLRGAAWLMSFDAANVELLEKTALACLAKASTGSGQDYRSLKGANSCVWALGRIATAPAVVALGRIRLGVRDERLSKQIAKAMADAAEQAGMTIDELEDIAVPTYGLERYATSTADIAGHTATIKVETTTDVAVTIRRPDGTVAKSVPAAVKADPEAKAALKALQTSAGEIAQALPVQRLRLERSWLSQRSWSGAEFRERLLDHPLMSWLAARLVWTVTPANGPTRSAFFLDGQPLDSGDRPASPPADDDRVALWHPIAASAEDVRAWRAFVLRHRIVQPIKQTHRELYHLTDAERRTETYSNRFAGHILRQHQSTALARLRGWSCRLRVWADVPNNEPTHIKIPAHGLAAEYWTEGVGGDDPEVTDAQAYVFLKTDQVRFRRLDDGGDWRRDGGRHLSLGPYVALTEIGAVVFSEVMRDIDLFVSVASIGQDSTWIDAGGDAHHPDQWRRGAAARYWHEFNAAELAESAKARRAFLAELVPQLAIAGRLRLDDRFLIVQGNLRTYRIHIGSGNIFMEPDNRYLCIVDKLTVVPKGDAIFLPFEGDRVLSLILSKAFLLAADDVITAPDIASQLR